MSSFWQLFKESWKEEWDHWSNIGNTNFPPENSGSGRLGTGSGDKDQGDDPRKKWELVYLKFREIEGRDPYSFQELVDWWNRI